MVIKTNKPRSLGIEASSAFWIWKAIKDLGHVALSAEDLDKPDLVINIDGHPPIGRETGVPYFLWDCDSFLKVGIFDNTYDQIFIGGAPEDLVKYPKGTVFLPHAFDPDYHFPLDNVKGSDIVFAGSLSSIYAERKRLTNLLHQHFGVLEIEPGLGEAYNGALNHGRIIFNRSLGEKNIPMRFFEGMAVGALLHNDTGNLEPFGIPHKHFIPYTNDENLVSIAREYLSDEPRLEELRQHARKHALENHTYKHRVQTILSYL